MKRSIFTLLIFFTPFFSFSQNKFLIEPNIDFGTINWIEKYYFWNVDDTNDPLALEPKINFSGSLVGYGLNVKYLFDRFELGLSSQLTKFNGNPKIDKYIQRPRYIIFDSFFEYGVSLGYKICEKDNFRTFLNLTGGSFSIINLDNANEYYSDRYFINPEIKLKYKLNRFCINASPGYKYYYTVGNNDEGNPFFEEFIHTFNLQFGFEYIL